MQLDGAAVAGAPAYDDGAAVAAAHDLPGGRDDGRAHGHGDAHRVPVAPPHEPAGDVAVDGRGRAGGDAEPDGAALPGREQHRVREGLHVDVGEPALADRVRLAPAGDVGDPAGDGGRADKVADGERGGVHVAGVALAGQHLLPGPHRGVEHQAGVEEPPRGDVAGTLDERVVPAAQVVGGGHHRRADPGRRPGRVHAGDEGREPGDVRRAGRRTGGQVPGPAGVRGRGDRTEDADAGCGQVGLEHVAAGAERGTASGEAGGRRDRDVRAARAGRARPWPVRRPVAGRS